MQKCSPTIAKLMQKYDRSNKDKLGSKEFHRNVKFLAKAVHKQFVCTRGGLLSVTGAEARFLPSACSYLADVLCFSVDTEPEFARVYLDDYVYLTTRFRFRIL